MGYEVTSTNEDGGTECRCGANFQVIVASCGVVNCPMCGSPCKVGACG